MCFSAVWWRDLLIFVVIVVAVIAILKVLVPYILSKLPVNMVGEGVAVGGQIVNIFIWAVVIIFVIYFAFALISCLMGLGGGPTLFPRSR